MIYEAWLDDTQIITAQINRSFYNGQSSCFWLLDEAHQYHLLVIEETISQPELVQYRLAVPFMVNPLQEYQLVEEHNRKAVLQYRFVVKSTSFQEKYRYDGFLGNQYHSDYTEFFLYAPTVQKGYLVLLQQQKETLHPLVYQDHGVYKVRVEGNLDKAQYRYHVKSGGVWREAIDPYGYALSSNGEYSVVIDPGKLSLPSSFHMNIDPVLYELSVRDFTSDPETTIVNKGKYLGLIETGRTTPRNTSCGLDYLKELGITAIQLMPIFANATIDDLNPQQFYNWGYDPIGYMVPEGSYATDATDPYTRIRELQEMVNALHKQGIGVIYDVVYNHLYDREYNVLNQLVPYYYFRYEADGTPANGSYCEDDLDSKAPMARHYLKTSLLHFIDWYGADGFRFDLMGLLDIETVRLLINAGKTHKTELLFYGEGWNMNTPLKEEEKTIIGNQKKTGTLGYFNDDYRNVLRGFSIYDQGYLNGREELAYNAINALAGSVLTEYPGCLFDSPQQSINFLECHDNATLYDRLYRYEEETKIRIQKLMIGVLLISQGIPLLHSGMEFARTKQGVDNSYNSGDAINQIEYERKDHYQHLVAYTKEVIALRKRLGLFTLKDRDAVQRCLSFQILPEQCLKLVLSCAKDHGELLILINPRNFPVRYQLSGDYCWLLDAQGKKEAMVTDEIELEAYSLSVLKKSSR